MRWSPVGENSLMVSNGTPPVIRLRRHQEADKAAGSTVVTLAWPCRSARSRADASVGAERFKPSRAAVAQRGVGEHNTHVPFFDKNACCGVGDHIEYRRS